MKNICHSFIYGLPDDSIFIYIVATAIVSYIFIRLDIFLKLRSVFMNFCAFNGHSKKIMSRYVTQLKRGVKPETLL